MKMDRGKDVRPHGYDMLPAVQYLLMSPTKMDTSS